MSVSNGLRVVLLATVAAVGSGAAILAGTPQGAKAAAADTKAADEKAAETYKTKCSICHAMDGNSPLPDMSFADGVWKHGTTVKEMVATISNGVPGTAMMPFKTQFTPEEIEALARYVRKFDKKLK